MREPDHFNKLQLFVRDALPCEWLTLADELREAAETLWKHVDEALRVEATTTPKEVSKVTRIAGVSRPYILLAGFALENLVKGLLVAADPSLITSGKLDQRLKSHRLVDLARSLRQFALSTEEAEFCEMAEGAIPYWGRYPVPLSLEGRLPEVALTPERRDTYLSLHNRLGQRLYDQIRDGWDSGVGPTSVCMRTRRYERDEPGTE